MFDQVDLSWRFANGRATVGAGDVIPFGGDGNGRANIGPNKYQSRTGRRGSKPDPHPLPHQETSPEKSDGRRESALRTLAEPSHGNDTWFEDGRAEPRKRPEFFLRS